MTYNWRISFFFRQRGGVTVVIAKLGENFASAVKISLIALVLPENAYYESVFTQDFRNRV
jgi:hypothetical protein